MELGRRGDWIRRVWKGQRWGRSSGVGGEVGRIGSPGGWGGGVGMVGEPWV